MISIRTATPDDLLNIQHTNLLCLPENYKQKYFIYHLMSWPNLSFVAENTDKRIIVGYVLAKLDEDVSGPPHGHITSLAVQRSYRRRGLAQRLMIQSSKSLIEIYNAQHVSLHVRRSNRAAFSLYSKVLGYNHIDTEEGYYADGEDGVFMQLDLVKYAKENGIVPAHSRSFFPLENGGSGEGKGMTSITP